MTTYVDWITNRLGSAREVQRFHDALAELADTGKPLVFVGRPMSGKTTMLELLQAASGGRLPVFDNASPRTVRLNGPAAYVIPLGSPISPLFRTASVFELKPIRTAMDPRVREELLSAPTLDHLRGLCRTGDVTYPRARAL